MSTFEPIPASECIDGMLEECVDEIDEFITTLQRYPEAVLAFALRIHLGKLLRALQERELCTPAEALAFLDALKSEARPEMQ